MRLRTESRMGRTGEELVRSLVECDGDGDDGKSNGDDGMVAPPWEILPDVDLPTDGEIERFWERGTTTTEDDASGSTDDVLVRATDLKVTREGTTLLSNLRWTVRRGERWHLAGVNGQFSVEYFRSAFPK